MKYRDDRGRFRSDESDDQYDEECFLAGPGMRKVENIDLKQFSCLTRLSVKGDTAWLEVNLETGDAFMQLRDMKDRPLRDVSFKIAWTFDGKATEMDDIKDYFHPVHFTDLKNHISELRQRWVASCMEQGLGFMEQKT